MSFVFPGLKFDFFKIIRIRQRARIFFLSIAFLSVSVLLIRIRIGSVFRSLTDPDPHMYIAQIPVKDKIEAKGVRFKT